MGQFQNQIPLVMADSVLAQRQLKEAHLHLADVTLEQQDPIAVRKDLRRALEDLNRAQASLDLLKANVTALLDSLSES